MATLATTSSNTGLLSKIKSNISNPFGNKTVQINTGVPVYVKFEGTSRTVAIGNKPDSTTPNEFEDATPDKIAKLQATYNKLVSQPTANVTANVSANVTANETAIGTGGGARKKTRRRNSKVSRKSRNRNRH